MSFCGQAPLYRQREFHQSPLWRILVDHGEEFLRTNDSRYGYSHGPMALQSAKVMEKLLRCGDPRCGIRGATRSEPSIPTVHSSGVNRPVDGPLLDFCCCPQQAPANYPRTIATAMRWPTMHSSYGGCRMARIWAPSGPGYGRAGFHGGSTAWCGENQAPTASRGWLWSRS